MSTQAVKPEPSANLVQIGSIEDKIQRRDSLKSEFASSGKLAFEKKKRITLREAGGTAVHERPARAHHRPVRWAHLETREAGAWIVSRGWDTSPKPCRPRMSPHSNWERNTATTGSATRPISPSATWSSICRTWKRRG